MIPGPVDRQLLPRTLGPWFGQFAGLTQVQRQAIPWVISGRDVLICSPTASGKTEAYAAPAAEIALAQGAAGEAGASSGRRGHGARGAAGVASTTVLIVSPTRALANDLKRRLAGPMDLVGLTFGRYTGEHKERTRGRLPSVVVTTPEAFDSLLARRPSALVATRVVVLDEIQVLDDTPRGDQLRVLLHRLEQVARCRPQRVAVSATVDRPAELAARYLRDAHVVHVPGPRRILGRAFDGTGIAEVGEHLEVLAAAGFRKILVFCRSRNQVESYGAKLTGRTVFGNHVYAHHGSLAKNARELVERLFLHAPSAVCFATLTLEMGIDIGTVDYVLLAGLPANVSSLLQRIGRGSRRGDTTRAGYAAKNAAERHVFETMFNLGKVGRLCASSYGFRPSVVVQQALVLACAGTYLALADVEAALPPAVLAELGEGACRAILDELVERELLERRGRDRFVAAESVEARYARGTLHSNIDEEPGLEVIDRLTGDVLGTIQHADSRRIEIAGKNRQVVKTDEDRILTDASRDSEPAYFRPSGSPSISLQLGRAVVEGLGFPPGALAVVAHGGAWVLLHGLGTVGSRLLVDGLGRQAGMGAGAILSSSAYTLKLSQRPVELPRLGLARFLDTRLDGLEKLTSPGPWANSVPRSLRRAATRRIAGVDEVSRFLASARLVEIDDPAPELTAVLGQL